MDEDENNTDFAAARFSGAILTKERKMFHNSGIKEQETRAKSGVQTLSSIFCTFVLFVLFTFFSSFFANFIFVYYLLRQFIQSSMQNLESVTQKMAELPLDASETPLLTPLIKKNSHNCYDSSHKFPCKIWNL